MHSLELVELAGLVASNSRLFLRLSSVLPEAELERYWTASKCRVDRWQLKLLELKEGQTALLGPTGGLHRFAGAVLEEIFTGEILARVWVGLLGAYDAQNGTCDAEPIARSVLAGHLEVRCRALSLVSTARDLALGGLIEVNRVRRQCERWTDLLLAEMAHCGDMSSLAYDRERMLEFASDVPRVDTGRRARAQHLIMQTALRAAFGCRTLAHSPNGDLNRQIAAGVLGCFPPEIFDGMGLLRSAWSARLLSAADDAEAMLEDYLAMSNVTVRNKPGRGRLRRF